MSWQRKTPWFPRADVTRGDPGDLVTPLLSGTVNAFTAVPNLVLTSDGVTNGGVWQLIVNTNVAPGANIAVTKLAAGANNTVLQTNGAGVVVWAALALAAITPGAVGTVLTTAGGPVAAWATIVDANVAVAAAIAGTKINPDFGAQNITTTGNLLLNAAGSFVRLGLVAGSGAGSAASAGTVRLQDDFIQAFRNIAETANLTALASPAGNDNLEVGGVLGGSRPGSIICDGQTNVFLRTAGGTRLQATATLIDIPTNALRLGLAPGSGAGAAAASGGLRMQGNGAVAGRVVFRNAADTGDIAGISLVAADVLYVGGAYPTRPVGINVDAGSYGILARAGATKAYWSSTQFQWYVADVSWNSTVVAPVLSQATHSAAAITGDLLTVHAQTVDSGGAGASTGGALDVYAGDGTDAADHGGHAYFGGGRNLGAGAGTDGNVGLNARAGDAINFQSMERGVYVIDAVTVPAGNPAGGGFLYSNAGAGTWRGSGGTVTVFAAAGPHCGDCGYDAWTVATYNVAWRSWHFVCGHCGAEYRGGPRSVRGRLSARQREQSLRRDMGWDEMTRVLEAA